MSYHDEAQSEYAGLTPGDSSLRKRRKPERRRMCCVGCGKNVQRQLRSRAREIQCLECDGTNVDAFVMLELYLRANKRRKRAVRKP